MDLVHVIGGAAACASVVSFVPQAVKVVKTRDTSAISAKMYSVTVAGFTLWVIYGALIAAYPLVVANSLCLLLASFILAMKLLPLDKGESSAGRIEPAP
jgi:MtN3 and saliva related transmembrane protein